MPERPVFEVANLKEGKPSCWSCGFFLPWFTMKPDLAEECQENEVDGYCGEMTNCHFFMPVIRNSCWTHCSKWMDHKEVAPELFEPRLVDVLGNPDFNQ